MSDITLHDSTIWQMVRNWDASPAKLHVGLFQLAGHGFLALLAVADGDTLLRTFGCDGECSCFVSM